MPRERNLAPDIHRLRQMSEAGDAVVMHVPAVAQVADALTKEKPADKLLPLLVQGNCVRIPVPVARAAVCFNEVVIPEPQPSVPGGFSPLVSDTWLTQF